MHMMPGRNQKHCFQGGKGAVASIFGPRFFSSNLKRGRESLSPPKYLVPRQKLIANLPQFAAISRNLPQFAAICRNLLLFDAICRNLPQFAAIDRLIAAIDC